MARFRDVLTSFTRNYIPGGPLYAAGALQFQGVQYRQDDPLPIGKMSKARHQRLFITKKANHVPTRKTSPAPPTPLAAPAAGTAATVQPAEEPALFVVPTTDAKSLATRTVTVTLPSIASAELAARVDRNERKKHRR